MSFNIHSYLRGPRKDRTWFGLTGEIGIAQTRGDYLFLDYMLAHHKKIVVVVELGTYRGLTAMYLGVCMALRDGHVYTFDKPKVGQINSSIKSHWPDNVHFVELDVLEMVDAVGSYIANNTLLICDNADKLLEARLYAPYIRGNSVMLVHDRGIEWEKGELLSEMWLAGLRSVHSGISEAMGSTYMAFVPAEAL